MGTKDKILEAALELFSKQGVKAVSVRDISSIVGVRESAMYRHFPSKQSVFDQLLQNYLESSKEFFAGINAQPSSGKTEQEHTAALYEQLNDKEFLRICGSVFTDFLTQPDIIKFWRMMSIERLDNQHLAGIWKTHLFEEPLAFQTDMFCMLIGLGKIKPADPEMLALEFYSPTLLLYINALPYQPGSPEFKQFTECTNRHMKHFRETYAMLVASG